MAIKKYFIDNEAYGVDAMNKIVSSLRTTGVDGEIVDCLKVTKATALSVYIAPGRGWVDGCQIELDATETRAVSSTAGTYSVIMQLSKTGEQTEDIDIVVIPGSDTGAHVLAYVTVSGDVITDVTDVRTHSKFNGKTADPNPAGVADWEPGEFVLLKDTIKGYYDAYATYQNLVSYTTCNGGVLDMIVNFYPTRWWDRYHEPTTTPSNFPGYITALVDGKAVGVEVEGLGKESLHTATFRLNVAAGSTITIQGKTTANDSSGLTNKIYISTVEFRIGRKADAVTRIS